MSHPASLGKYRVTGVLGEGAMGVVYRGYDPGIRRNVAIKTIRHLGAMGDAMAGQLAARFSNEAQAAGRLQHPGIVGIYDYGDDGDVSYIAMEFVEGHTLSAYLARRVAFGEADLASIAVQLLDALGHAHANGVWHRDIKPSNVILTPGGRVKIADFGIARTDNIGLTMAGTMLGTPMYMAPEQFLGQPFDHRVDLYATGVLLYQMLAARPPFTGSQEALMYKVVHEAPLPPSAAEDGTRSPRYDAVVLRALAKGPGERWSDAAAFAAAVAAALGTTVPSAVSPAAVNALPPPPGFEPTERIAGVADATPRPPSRSEYAGAASAGTGGSPGTGSGTDGSAARLPSHWDAAQLAQVEHELARHVGPLAAVMVRRAARDCADLNTLYARLGEQITQASVRDAFLAQVLRGTGGTTRLGAIASSTAVAAPTPAPATRATPAVSDALIEQAQKLLAAHLGPIAKVVVRRAVERTRQREALFALLVEATPDAAKAKVAAELNRLS